MPSQCHLDELHACRKAKTDEAGGSLEEMTQHQIWQRRTGRLSLFCASGSPWPSELPAHEAGRERQKLRKPACPHWRTRNTRRQRRSRQLSCSTGEMKVSTSTVAALFSKMALTGQKIAMVEMVLLVLPAFPYLP